MVEPSENVVQDIEGTRMVLSPRPHDSIGCDGDSSSSRHCGRIVAAKDEGDRLFWEYVVQLEYAAIFAVTWWHECSRGHRGFYLRTETIEWLEQVLGDMAVDPDTNKVCRVSRDFVLWHFRLSCRRLPPCDVSWPVGIQG